MCEGHAPLSEEDDPEEHQGMLRVHFIRLRIHPQPLRCDVRSNQGLRIAVRRIPCRRSAG